MQSKAGKRGGARSGSGRKAHVPTEEIRKQIYALASYGVQREEIAKAIGLHENTILKYYRDTLETAGTKANALIAQSLFNKARGNGPSAVTAAIFWLKTRAGWKEPLQLEHSGGVIIKIGKEFADL